MKRRNERIKREEREARYNKFTEAYYPLSGYWNSAVDWVSIELWMLWCTYASIGMMGGPLPRPDHRATTDKLT